MPESRDRLSRPVDIAALFAARRQPGSLGIYVDQPELDMALFSSPRLNAARQNRTVVGAGRGIIGRGRGGLGTPTGRGRRTPVPTGRENRAPLRSARGGRGRGSNSMLPAWYPRTPLREITAVIRSIERRRERLGGIDGQEIRSPLPGRMMSDPTVSTPDAHLKHSNGYMSPIYTLGVKGCSSTIGKVPKLLLDIANKAPGDSESLTPQKKLLNSIDTVEKVVMEELRKLKRTPSAKKAEREKRVRTLMSMR